MQQMLATRPLRLLSQIDFVRLLGIRRNTKEMIEMRRDGFILGLNSAYHEPAACLILDGEIVAAAEEERFNRVRHGKHADLLNPHWLPVESIRFCLRQAGITARELTHIGYSFVPGKRLAFNVGIDAETVPGAAGTVKGERIFYRLLSEVPARLSELLGEDVRNRFQWIEHHLCHAASAFFVSPFERAAVMSVDGIGEATSTWLGMGSGTQLTAIREIPYPNSLGLLWTKTSRFLGFGSYGQWKVMGLGGYGNPDRFYGALRSFVRFDEDGHFTIDPGRLQYRTPNCSGFDEFFGAAREPNSAIEQRHRDLAAGLQRITNKALLALARYLHRETGCNRLCQAGGVALNCVANRVLLEEGPFEETFIQPAANDAGTALGACYYIWNQLLGNRRGPALPHVYLGPSYSSQLTGDFQLPAGCVTPNTDNLESAVARLLASGEIVAWFEGRMEFGPRALGNRSFLADPRRPEIVHLLNEKVKHREYFRPFAASVLDEQAEAWFEFPRRSRSDAFMLYARKLRPKRLGAIPAVTHVDNTCRLQRVSGNSNPRFHRLIAAFEALTGVPLLLNTSLNDREPIVCTPQEVLSTCLATGIRYLVLEDRLVKLPAGSPTAEPDALAGSTKFPKTADRELTSREGKAPGSSLRPDTEAAANSEQAATSVLTQECAREVLDQPLKLSFRSR